MNKTINSQAMPYEDYIGLGCVVFLKETILVFFQFQLNTNPNLVRISQHPVNQTYALYYFIAL